MVFEERMCGGVGFLDFRMIKERLRELNIINGMVKGLVERESNFCDEGEEWMKGG